MTNANTRQIAEWNGAAGDSWWANYQRFDRMLRPFSDALMVAAHVQAGEKVLEIGCGAGTLAIEMARTSADVTAVDVSQGLIDLARNRQKDAGLSIDFHLGDASHMAFSPEFDLLFSHLGVMFFDDPAAAFANMRGALKAEGRLACLAWRSTGENEAAALPEAALAPDLTAPVRPPEAPGPFSFGDRDRIQRILTEAGFKEIAIEPFDAVLLFGEGEDRDAALDDALDMAYHIGPLRRWLVDADEAVKARVHQRLRQLFTSHITPKGVELKGAAWIITASNS